MDWVWVILAGLGGGVLSLLLGLLLVNNKKEAVISSFATAFAAGTLLAAAFLDLIPEALHHGEELFEEEHSGFFIMCFVLVGIVAFFLLEGLLHSFHHHSYGSDCKVCEEHKKHLPLMITLGDSLHNFMDGIAIAVGFLISPITGLIVTLAVIAHEIPQEIGDIAIMRTSGMDKKKVIWLNVLSSLASLLGAVIFFAIGEAFDNDAIFAPVFAITAGFFIYIATTDIIPTIHQETNKKVAIWKMVTMIAGIVVLGLLIYFLHGLVEAE